MYIHGKLFLTHHKLMLDEVKSLLQKALRRKEWVLALQASKELLGYEKDQLPFKSIVTFLFEDHCLSDTDVLMVVFKAYEEGTREAKYRCIELLMQCKTCRVTACLPVIALDTPYEPKNWDPDIEVRESITGLLMHNKGQMNVDLLLEHLLRAWTENNPDRVITYIKLASMVADQGKRQLTAKGKEYLISNCGRIRKPNFGLIVLSALYKNTDDPTMRGYLAACHRIATIPDVCVRLILFAPLTRLMFSHQVSEVPNKKLGRVDWKTIRKLTYMPPWAVDKHTFRGKFGRGTQNILKQRPHGMTEEQYEEFHGSREKRDIQTFFDEGVKCAKGALDENPFWERTKELYTLQPPKQQKTQCMTEQYFVTLREKYPELFQKSKAVTFDYTRKRNGDVSCMAKEADDNSDRRHRQHSTHERQKKLEHFFQPAATSPSQHIKEEITRRAPPQEERKRKQSEVSDSDESAQAGLSRAKRRRLKETERRRSEYETERLPSSRKVSGTMSGEFAAAARRLGCPVNLPENLFDEDDEIFKCPTPAKPPLGSSFSEDSSSDFVSVASPMGSPVAAYLSGTELPRSASNSALHSNSFGDRSFESNGVDEDLLAGLEQEFEDDMADFESSTEVQQEEGEEDLVEESEDEEVLSFRGPLLQLPTSANKVYTVADIEEDKVIKGPYHDRAKMHQVMFLHQCMRDVIGDPHTLDFEPDPPYLTFPLLRGHGATMEITTRNFSDCISQADIEDAEFLTRDCLGIVQLHKLLPQQIRKLPMSIWAHFLYRFALNVGDSGLYNAITDSKLSFVYGIDMEERRGELKSEDSILDLMFSKAPRKNLCEAILLCIKHKKVELFRLVSKQINYAQMDRLGREYGVDYDRLVFIDRIKKVRRLVAKM